MFLYPKGGFKVYPLPPDPNDEMPSKVFTNLPSSTPEECIVRVYVICGIDFQPNDTSGLVCTWLSLIIIDRIQNPTLACRYTCND